MKIKKYFKYATIFFISLLLPMYVFRNMVNNLANMGSITGEKFFKYSLLMEVLLILAVFLIAYGITKYHAINKKASKGYYIYPQNKSTLINYGGGFEDDWKKCDWQEDNLEEDEGFQINSYDPLEMDNYNQLFMNQQWEFLNQQEIIAQQNLFMNQMEQFMSEQELINHQEMINQQDLFMNQNIEFTNWSIDDGINNVTPIEFGGYDMSQQDMYTSDLMNQDFNNFSNGF